MEELLKDLYKTECRKSQTYLTICFILTVLFTISIMVCLALAYELSTYEQVQITTETYEQDIEGDNGNTVNGNQYNDSATHNEGSGIDG